MGAGAGGLNGRPRVDAAGGVECVDRRHVGLRGRDASGEVRDRCRRAAEGVGKRSGDDALRIGHVLGLAHRVVGVGRVEPVSERVGRRIIPALSFTSSPAELALWSTLLLYAVFRKLIGNCDFFNRNICEMKGQDKVPESVRHHNPVV